MATDLVTDVGGAVESIVVRKGTPLVMQAAENFIVEHGYDPIYGARPLKRFLQKHVETLSAKLILADEVHANDVILIDVDGDHLTP